MFTATSNLVTHPCRITVTFWNSERWKSLIDILASKKYFSHRNIFQNVVDTKSFIHSYYRCQHLQRQYEIPYRKINFFTLNFEIKLSHVFIAFDNCKGLTYICYSSTAIFTTRWRNSNKIRSSELYKILSFKKSSLIC